MELKSGMKKTEVGIIPYDWEVKRMSDIGESFIGLTYSPTNVKRYGTLVLRSSNVQNGKLKFEDNVFVDMDLPQRVIVKENDILICVRNGSRQLIGKCALIDQKTSGSAFGAFMSIYRTEYSKLIFHQFQSSIIQRQINETLGATINQITNKDLSVFKICFPPTKAEQTAIATALSDADALIKSLEKLIAKKRNIKQGAMQKLLAPKKGWVIKAIGSEIELLTGFPFPSDKYSSSGIRLLRGSNVKRGVTDWASDITQYWEKLTPELKPYLLNDGDIVIAMDGSLVGRSFARLSPKDLPALLLQRVARIRSTKIDMGYLKEFICSDIFTKHCDSVKTVSAIPHISPGDIRSFKIPIPPDKDEQRTIAETLSDMGTEIESLEIKLEKCRKIKLAMMQVLLTGKIRLI